MAIPQIVSGSLVSTPSSGVKMDGSAMREAALAPGQVAGAIGQSVGGLFEDVSQKIQANKNAGIVFRADLAMRKTKDDFTAQLATMPDPTTWLPAWNARTSALKDSIMDGPNVGPDVKKHLGRMFDNWEQATTGETKIAALLKQNANTREDAVAAATYAAHQGDLEGANNAIKVAVDNYAMSTSDAHKISVRFPSIAAQAQADVAIATNPIKAPDIVKQFEGTIEPRVFVGVMAHANESRNRAQAANINDLAVQLDDSPDGTIDPDLIKARVKSGEITQRGADGLIARMTKQKKADSQRDFSVAYSEAYDHNWTDDKTPEASARELKDRYSYLPDALRTRLYKDIDGRVSAAKKEGQQLERPVETQVLSQMRQDREDEGAMVPFTEKKDKGDSTEFSHRVQGGLKALKNPDIYSDEQLKKDFGPNATREKVMEAEKLHYAQVQQQMREWFRDPANKDATVEQANKQRQTLERPWVMSVVNRLSQKKPRLVKQNGKTYNFDTGEEVQ